MKFLFQVSVLFLIVFNFRLPFIYNSAYLSIILTTVYYISKESRITFTYFYQRYTAIILVGTIFVAIVAYSIPLFHNTEIMTDYLRRILVQLMMLFAVIFALPILLEGDKSKALEKMAIIICYAYAIQGVISLAAYLYQPLGNFLFDMKPEWVKEDVSNPANNLPVFRLYNLSGIFFVELTAAYGVAYIAYFWLQLKSNHPYIFGWKKHLILIFIISGTIFAGRTGFIGFFMGLGGWLLFSLDRILLSLKRNFWYIVSFVVLLLFSYNSLLNSAQRKAIQDDVFPFAFEWYYNYMDYGRIDVGSAEALPDHYYYLSDETLLKGHGINANTHPTYPNSDAGFMNFLIFGGIPFLICMAIYQSLYFIRPLSFAWKNNSRNSWINTAFFLMLFLYIFIVHIKTSALGTLHVYEVMCLALGSSFITQYYAQKEQGEIVG